MDIILKTADFICSKRHVTHWLVLVSDYAGLIAYLIDEPIGRVRRMLRAAVIDIYNQEEKKKRQGEIT